MIVYPTRCRVIGIEGQAVPGAPHLVCKTPEISKPHVGKLGVAERTVVGGYDTVRLTLDDGTVLYGYECWWEPVKGAAANEDS